MSEFTKRNLLLSAAAIITVGAIGAVVELPKLLHVRGHSPYDDVISATGDPDKAALIGRAVLNDLPKFDVAATAKALRKRTTPDSVTEASMHDSDEGNLLEADGWVLPETLALACAVAAKVNA
jgi:hypothetical protein